MKPICAKWAAILLLAAGALTGFAACFVTDEMPKLVMLVPATALLIAGCTMMVLGIRCPVCGSRIGLKYSRGLLEMTHCPDCGAELFKEE